MIPQPPKIPNFLTRNPLGIVALFISLIYGMSALLLGATVSSINEQNQNTLVKFIVLFPMVVLGAFLFLVTRHHKKLYGPGDYRSDDAFNSAEDASPSSLGKKISEDLEEAEKGPVATVQHVPDQRDSEPHIRASEISDQEASVLPNVMPEKTIRNSSEFNRFSKKKGNMARAYAAQSLVLQDIQKRLNTSIRRDVVIPLQNGKRIQVDGMIKRNDGEIILIEVKFLRNIENLSFILGNAKSLANSLRENAKYFSDSIFYLALVFEDKVDTNQLAQALTKHEFNDKRVAVFPYNYSDLANKYGIDLDL